MKKTKILRFYFVLQGLCNLYKNAYINYKSKGLLLIFFINITVFKKLFTE
jgi:hypothetical protein